MMPTRRYAHVLVPALVAWSCGGGDLTVPGGDPASASGVLMVDGDQQTAPAGDRLADPLIVRLLDPAGAPLADRTVVWVIKSGGGSVDPVTSTTDAGGYASTRWTLGTSGVNTVDAQVPDVGAVTFTATATTTPGGGGPEPSPARSSIAAVPDSIVAGSGTATILVTVLDEAGAPVPGATVVLAATGSGNTLTQPASVTGADGTATGALEAATPGRRTVSATVNGSVSLDQTVVVTVTSETPTVDHLIFSVQPPERVGERETFRVEVSLVDANGTVVPRSGIFVYLGLFRDKQDHPSNDRLGGDRFANTADGVAVFDIDVEKKGKYSLRALTDDLPELGPHGPEPYLFSRVFEVK